MMYHVIGTGKQGENEMPAARDLTGLRFGSHSMPALQEITILGLLDLTA